ncbi:LacI family DNA-binding transcriptional regulator [Micromonospora inyonensis]|uniref:Transcriptional regulator, LacI family n=1 Tax=Micromonospora inyonensis TaxID=47866 RepID=A0A1C6RJP2_9ACTN|nr:LacI family DNA-binding transcriptional regulator [Micromonospora inyonensis]SCL17416.1 transcriptional regulator, LacI family [Micromonospora inyonensis]
MAKGPATIPDVAKAAGVSTATAARALGGYGHVSERFRERVLAAAEELGYRPNALARSMITGRTQSLGLVVADIENPFFAAVTRAVGDAARVHGYEVLLANSDEDVATERSSVRLFLDKRVDGIIVAPASSTDVEHLREAQAAGVAVVAIDRRVTGIAADSVTVHNRAAAAAAVMHFLAAGHTRIGYLRGTVSPGEHDGLGRRISTGDERLLGYRESLRSAGLDPDRYVRVGCLGRKEALHAMLDLLGQPDPPTAVLTPDSILALGVLLAARERGLAIPDDLSVISFDDTDWADVVTPPLSVISQPVHAMGARAVELLLDRIDRAHGRARHVRLRARMVERASVGPPPGVSSRSSSEIHPDQQGLVIVGNQ